MPRYILLKHFAKEAFDFIRANPNCTIIISDFTNFFDTLDHAYLKQQLCALLESKHLPDDFYKVFKSITNYAFVEERELLEFMEKEGITASSKLPKVSLTKAQKTFSTATKPPSGA